MKQRQAKPEPDETRGRKGIVNATQQGMARHDIHGKRCTMTKAEFGVRKGGIVVLSDIHKLDNKRIQDIA